jgi:maltose alpha-D-glucosyltransferase/alpha-amylase
MRNMATNSFALLAKHVESEKEPLAEAKRVLSLEEEALARFRALLGRTFRSIRIRSHGDYHLGQVLYTGNDFLITDFEGEPARSLSDRRLKRSPLRDVAGMLRSFSYVAHAGLREQHESGVGEKAAAQLALWAQCWQAWSGAAFLSAYLEEGKRSRLFADHEEVDTLLSVFMLEKAVYEIAYELNNRPDWLQVPLQGILELLEAPS